MSVAISGATTYSASGPLNSGDLRVPMRGNDVLGVRGVGSITGPGGGSTRVGIDVTRVEWLGISIGRVAVYDLSAQLNLVLPYFGRLARQDGAVSGMARGIQNVGAPTWFAPVQIDWSVSDAG